VSQFFVTDGGGLYRCQAFDVFAWQTHGFGTRHASPPAQVTLRQIHSAKVVNASGLEDRQAEGDGLITNKCGIAIGVRTADCVPLLLLDRRTRVVGAIHAGWRGTAASIVEEALRCMRTNFETQPEDVYAAIGPCIRACCYQVGMDVAERFREWNAVRPGNHVDLAAANRLQMMGCGIPQDQIFDCGICTFCDANQFYSFRREPQDPGRMTSAICRRL
jgi:YfiH family protein